MTTAAMKKEIVKSIDAVHSEALIKAIYLLLNAEVKQMQKTIKPFTIQEFYARAEKSEKDIKAGRVIDSSRVRAKFSSK